MNFLKTQYKKIIIALVILLIIFFGFRSSQSKKTANDLTTYNPKKDIVVSPKKETIKDELNLSGSVDATEKSNLTFQTGGQLAWLGVKVGDKVKKYQAIASLNKEQLKKQLQTSFNNYESSLSSFYDTTDKYKDTVLTEDIKRILLRNQNTLDNSVISYEINDLAIKYATLVTPIEGIVVSIDAPASGMNITPLSAISIINPKSIYFKADIDQEDVVKVKVGDKAIIKLDSFPDKTFESTIDYIAFTPVAGQSSTVYETRFKLPQDNDNLQYRLGMDGDVNVELKSVDNALIVSTDAVYQDDQQQKYVLVKTQNSNKLEKRIIKTGIETDTQTQILEGITENDQIVVKK